MLVAPLSAKSKADDGVESPSLDFCRIFENDRGPYGLVSSVARHNGRASIQANRYPRIFELRSKYLSSAGGFC